MASRTSASLTLRRERLASQHGIAMITALMVMTLVSALLVGFTTVVMSDQKFRFIDRDRSQAFYAANGGLERLTFDLGRLYMTNVSPTEAQVLALTTTPPVIPGVTFTATNPAEPLPASQVTDFYCNGANRARTRVGGNGYSITFCKDTTTNRPTTTANTPIRTGSNAGLIALQTPFQLDVTAKTSYGGDVHLVKTFEAVAIPVFQFGMFSDMDLSFFAGPNFGFGGRVHTNGDLYLAQGNGNTLTLSDRVTAFREVVRNRLQNNVIIGSSGHTGTVSMTTGPSSAARALAAGEGSVLDGLLPTRPTAPPGLNDPTWWNLSKTTYNGWIRNGRTDATRLVLPVFQAGAPNIALIQRPSTTVADSPDVLAERLFTKASIRILLSDTAADITGLPTVTATAPVQLDGDWLATPPNNGTAYGPLTRDLPPIATSVTPVTTTVTGSTLTGGVYTITLGVPAAQIASFLPPMRILGPAGSPGTISAVCLRKNSTTVLDNCTLNPTGPPTGTQLFASGVTIPLASGSTATSLNFSAANLANLRVRPIWIGTNPARLVTCTGWNNTSQLTGCTGATISNGNVVSTGSLTNAGVGRIGGFLKVEMQNSSGVWSDITMQILNWGIGDRNVSGTLCTAPSQNAIIRLQRLRDNSGTGCGYEDVATGALDAANWWPNVLFDPREALQRDIDVATTEFPVGGVMHYITLDVDNLAEWLTATAPYAGSPGVNAMRENGGFTVYFSDRRNNRTDAAHALGANRETGEYGWEDVVNPTFNATSTSNSGVLDPGEDFNLNNLLDTYGMFPSYNGASNTLPPGWPSPAVANTISQPRPWVLMNRGQAQTNRAVLFRRALKLTNGSNIAARGVTGLTVVSENPVYVHGDWNATGGNFAGAHAATSIIADAVTLLSNNWADSDTFTAPYDPGDATRQRPADSFYRVAIIGGKGWGFERPGVPIPTAGVPNDFGTDGGAHNFLRFLEGGGTVNYRGSLATFYVHRQGVGTYKCCDTVYGAPTRNYAFDTDFLDPALLPPNTPKFRDLDAVGFSQEIRPGK